MPTIKELRRARFMSQTELAKVCDVSLNTVWMWENGYRKPGLKNLEKLCQVFGTDDIEGLGGEPEDE